MHTERETSVIDDEMNCQVQMVPIGTIYIPEDRRKTEPENVEAIAESIRMVGLLNPITLVAKDGYLSLVAGGNRLAACVLLGLSDVPAIVRDLDVVRAELAEITENLHRTPLRKHARDAALARWRELYDTCHPDGKPERRFDEHAADVTGLAPRTVRQSVQRGRAFDDADREVFEERGLPPSAVDPIAAIPDPAKRKAAVAAVAEGASPEAAVETVVGPPAELVDDEMSDGEWLDTLPLAGQVADPERFKADALLYRRMVGPLQQYRKASGPYLKAKGKAHGGRLHWLLSRPIDVKHPRHWLLCGGCGGKGCSECRQAGYKVD